MAYTNKTTRTQKKIQESLLSLMQEKKFETITINDITELADVNRSTFYRHYLDKYDLLEKIEHHILDDANNFYNSVIENVKPRKITKDFLLTDYINSKNNFFTIFKPHLSTIKILLDSGSSSFRENLSKTMIKTFERSLSLVDAKITATQKELLFTFLSGTILNNIYYWTDHQDLSPEEIFDFSINIMSNGVVNFIKQNMN